MTQERTRKSLTFRESSTELTMIVRGKIVTEKSQKRELVIPNKLAPLLVTTLLGLIVLLVKDGLSSIVSGALALLSR